MLVTDGVLYHGEEHIDEVVELIKRCGRVLTAGNGGSSSSASHFTQDLMKAAHTPSLCLSDNVPFVLATANDSGFENVYADYLELNGKTSDILLMISGSGNSLNLLTLAKKAVTMNIQTVAMVGMTGGELSKICDHVIHVPLMDMRMAESAHSVILHYIIERLQ
jgi:D-sedoheptulose 7-phosphate isomerase